MPRLRFLLVTRNFPPLVGGMEKLNARMFLGLLGAGPGALCGPAGAAGHVPQGTLVKEAGRGSPAVVLLRLFASAMALAVRCRPRVILAGSGLTAPIAWVAARCSRARAVAYVHGLDLVADHMVYRTLWLPFIRRMDHVVANSRNTAALAEQVGVPRSRISVVTPGCDPPTARAGRLPPELRAALDGRRILLSVGRLTPRKGLAEFVGQALPLIVGALPNAMLLVVGEDATQALRQGGAGEGARIDQAARAAGVEANVLRMPHCPQEVLDVLMARAGCHVFPVRELPGDVEGFGMVALESAASGLWTVAFDVGGVIDAIGPGESGTLVPANDHAAFADAVVTALSSPAEERSAGCRAFAQRHGWDRFNKEILGVLHAVDG